MSVFNAEIQQAYQKRRKEIYEAVKDMPRIKELDLPLQEKHYKIIPKEEGFKEIINAQVIIIVGGYFGDEGKGKWGNLLAQKVDAVVRANSGANTGRTAYKG